MLGLYEGYVKKRQPRAGGVPICARHSTPVSSLDQTLL